MNFRQFPFYNKLLSMGYRDVTSNAQTKHGTLSFRGDPEDEDDSYMIYHQGVIRTLTSGRPRIVREGLGDLKTEKDYDSVIKILIDYINKKNQKYVNFFFRHRKEVIRITFEVENRREIMPWGVYGWEYVTTPKIMYKLYSHFVKERQKESI